MFLKGRNTKIKRASSRALVSIGISLAQLPTIRKPILKIENNDFIKDLLIKAVKYKGPHLYRYSRRLNDSLPFSNILFSNRQSRPHIVIHYYLILIR